MVGQPVEPPPQKCDPNALWDQEGGGKHPQVAGGGRDRQTSHAEGEQHCDLGILGRWPAPQTTEVVHRVEQLGRRPAKRQLPRRCARRVGVWVVVVVVYILVVRDVDEPERREGEDRRDEDPSSAPLHAPLRRPCPLPIRRQRALRPAGHHDAERHHAGARAGSTGCRRWHGGYCGHPEHSRVGPWDNGGSIVNTVLYAALVVLIPRWRQRKSATRGRGRARYGWSSADSARDAAGDRARTAPSAGSVRSRSAR
jgi:hypothetical protein